MKVLIIRTFPDILNMDMYNVQEIGLAKALVCKGIECGVVLYNGRNADKTENFEFYSEGRCYFFTIYWLKGIGVLKNGFMPSVYKIIPGYDVIQVHEYDQVFSWMLYTKQKRPTIIYHGPYYHAYAKGYNLKCRIFDLLFLWCRKHDHVIALTKSELAANFLREKGFEHVTAVGVGVDPDMFKAEDEEIVCRLQVKSTAFRILYVGKIEERRNVYFLIDLFERLLIEHNNLEMVIVGDGEPDYTAAFLIRIDKLIKTGKLKYFNKATQKELAVIYQRANLFLFTSNYEIFGMVLLEALYFGLPVVSSVNGGASVLIRDGINGYMIENFDMTEWQRRIGNIMEDSKQYLRMKEEAQKTIENHFLWGRLADKFIAAYEEAIQLYDNGKIC